jgi:hypothetical protein
MPWRGLCLSGRDKDFARRRVSFPVMPLVVLGEVGEKLCWTLSIVVSAGLSMIVIMKISKEKKEEIKRYRPMHTQ